MQATCMFCNKKQLKTCKTDHVEVPIIRYFNTFKVFYYDKIEIKAM